MKRVVLGVGYGDFVKGSMTGPYTDVFVVKRTFSGFFPIELKNRNKVAGRKIRLIAEVIE